MISLIKKFKLEGAFTRNGEIQIQKNNLKLKLAKVQLRPQSKSLLIFSFTDTPFERPFKFFQKIFPLKITLLWKIVQISIKFSNSLHFCG